MTIAACLLRAAFLPAVFGALVWLLDVDLDFALPEPPPVQQAYHANDSPVWVGPDR